ncbi:MAG TPA: CHAT domain-containing protein, partial [Roseiflexaceae bacterium]|nr:CHAT domain-containing protein [Roseiflexaceae bacterium]
MRYADFVIEAFDVPAEPGDDPNSYTFKVRVLASDAGQHSIGQASKRSYDRQQLQERINLLSDRGLDQAGLIAFGRDLASWLLPADAPPGAASVRSLFERSRSLAGQDGGVRLRLQLATADLARIPWEYLYIDPAGGGDQMDGFLALDPRVAIVRHESLSIDVPRLQLPPEVPLKVVAAMALAADLGQLDLAQEQESLGKIFAEKGVAHEFLEQSTIEDILEHIHDAHVFHFAGHGEFATARDRPRTYVGTGALALAGGRVDSEQLSLNLRGNQLRLAVLGACESGKRGGGNVINPWGAIAPMLIKIGVPAVVANQFKIADACAIAFSTAFYQALFGGLSVERAVTAGRLAAYNADKAGRDWGVPVLYMLSEDGQLFAGVADEPARAQAAAAAEAIIQERIEVITNIVQTDGGAAIMAPIESGRDTTINNTVIKEQVASKFVVDKLFVGGAVEPDPTPTPPMLPRHYAPRKSLEQELRAKLLSDDDSAPVTILWGVQGTGKGALATAVADRLFNHDGQFAGGVLWGDCSSRSVEELVRDFLTALGRRWYDPGALQRTVTAEQLWLALDERHKQADGDDRRTLVIVDNVRDLSQLKQLLPHSRTRSRLLAISDGAIESAELPIGGSCHVG